MFTAFHKRIPHEWMMKYALKGKSNIYIYTQLNSAWSFREESKQIKKFKATQENPDMFTSNIHGEFYKDYRLDDNVLQVVFPLSWIYFETVIHFNDR